MISGDVTQMVFVVMARGSLNTNRNPSGLRPLTTNGPSGREPVEGGVALDRVAPAGVDAELLASGQVIGEVDAAAGAGPGEAELMPGPTSVTAVSVTYWRPPSYSTSRTLVPTWGGPSWSGSSRRCGHRCGDHQPLPTHAGAWTRQPQSCAIGDAVDELVRGWNPSAGSSSTRSASSFLSKRYS